MSLSNNFPSVNPTLLLDFAKTKRLDPRITFTRGSTATFYDGKTVAKAEENLALQSQTFTTAPWSGSSVTVSQNTGDTTAPDGTSTAAKFTANAVTANHFRTQVNTSINGANYTTSVFAKKGTNNFIQIYISFQSGSFANFDLDLGVVGTSASVVSSSIQDVGNGWYRCVVVWTASGTNRYPTLKIAQTASDTGAMSWAAAGTEALYVWGFQLEQRSSVTAYTVTTTAPITNYIPALQTAAAGVARFEHNPITGESLGLEIEEQRTNLLLRSEDFTTTWSLTNTSITANSFIAPDGTLTADQIVTTASSGNRFALQTVSVSSGTYTYSVYLKAYTATSVNVRLLGSTDTNTTIDLSNGTVTSGTATITAVGNGWYRCAVTATGTSLNCYVYVNGASTGISVAAWGAQLEAGSFATSYIPTVASQVTRINDVANMTGTNLTSWFKTNEGTFYGEISNITQGIDRRWMSLYDGVNGQMQARLAAQNLYVYTATEANAAARTINGATTTATVVKAANTYSVNDLATTLNGGTVFTGSVWNPITPTSFTLGANVNNFQAINNCIKKLAYYPARLTNTQLQALTTL